MRTFIGIIAAASFAVIVLILDGFYIVNEGHVGVVTRWGEAVDQERPSGLKVKMPIATQIKEFDVRERRAEETLAAATANQLPIDAIVTVNWRMDPDAVLDVFRNYGSPEQFESNILAPRVRQAAKAGLSQYQASDLIRDRTAAANTIFVLLTEALENYPASVQSLQIENVSLPPRYREAVLAKEEAREAAAREEYNLERQRLESRRLVQSAESERDAAQARADGEAYRITTEAEAKAKATIVQGQADAQAISAKVEALEANPMIIEYERVLRWDGQMPRMMLGNGADLSLLMSADQVAQ